MLFKRDIYCFNFPSNSFVSISLLISIGKEMYLPGFLTLPLKKDLPDLDLSTIADASSYWLRLMCLCYLKARGHIS